MAPIRWYVAVLVFRAEAGSVWDADRLTERQVRLLRASSPDEAYERALALGKNGEHSYSNASGEDVRWSFAGLAELDELMASEPVDGVEIISSFSTSDPEVLIRARDDLAVFWSQRNANTQARDLLE